VNLDLGGPGPGCSAMRVRRLAAGELAGVEKERTLAHVAECPRCLEVQREILEEREALRREVPFPAFAAGVAEKLAQRPQRPSVARRAVTRWAPLAAAAGLALVAGRAVLRPADTESVRGKGAATAQLFVQDARGARELARGEPVAQGARLLLSLHPGGRKQATAVLIEPGETSVIYAGPALNGPLPQAFEWTGSGKATLLIVLSDQPLDASRIRGRRDVPRGAEAIELTLHR
jgi:hypothetical protein